MSESTERTIEATYCKVDVIAKLFGISVRRVQQLTQSGIICTVKVSRSNRYDLEDTVKRYTKYLSDKAYGRTKTETEEGLKEQKLVAEIALKESQGELHRLRTAIMAGEYISIEEVKMDYGRFFLSFKKFALSLPSKIAGRLTGSVEPVEIRRLEKEMQKEAAKLLKGFVVAANVEEKQKALATDLDGVDSGTS